MEAARSFNELDFSTTRSWCPTALDGLLLPHHTQLSEKALTHYVAGNPVGFNGSLSRGGDE